MNFLERVGGVISRLKEDRLEAKELNARTRGFLDSTEERLSQVEGRLDLSGEVFRNCSSLISKDDRDRLNELRESLRRESEELCNNATKCGEVDLERFDRLLTIAKRLEENYEKYGQNGWKVRGNEENDPVYEATNNNVIKKKILRRTLTALEYLRELSKLNLLDEIPEEEKATIIDFIKRGCASGNISYEDLDVVFLKKEELGGVYLPVTSLGGCQASRNNIDDTLAREKTTIFAESLYTLGLTSDVKQPAIQYGGKKIKGVHIYQKLEFVLNGKIHDLLVANERLSRSYIVWPNKRKLDYSQCTKSDLMSMGCDGINFVEKYHSLANISGFEYDVKRAVVVHIICCRLAKHLGIEDRLNEI